MVHTSKQFSVRNGSVGCVAKNITYKGVAAHTGGSPWNGKNVLYAANCGLNAVNAICEMFKEKDIIRVHPIITAGGEMVNAIPDTAKMQLSMLRLLLKDNASRTKKILAEFKPMFKSKEEYLGYVDKINSSGDRINYVNGEAKIKL